MTPEHPALSVVIVAGDRHERVASAIRSVLEQDGAELLEVVIVDCGTSGAQPYADHPQVRVVRPADESHYGEALAFGVTHARAEIIAFLEEHARAQPGWARALMAIHESDCAAAACEVHVGNPNMGLSEGWGLMGYGMWYAPMREGDAEFVHGYNAACKRSVLLSYGERLPRLLLADTAFANRLLLDGHRLMNAPGARIDHLNETKLLLPLRKTFLAHRFSAPARAEECGWSPLRRMVYAIGSPLLPLYGFWCQWRLYTKQNRELRRTLLRIIPLFVITHLAMAAGTTTGLLFGPGDAARQFTWLELNVDRPEAEPA